MGELWYGGKIYTMGEEGERAEAVFTEGNTIMAVGTYEGLYSDFSEKIDQVHDLQGKTMLPGFVDAHLHIMGHGEKLLRLDLSQMTSREEIKDALKDRSANLAKGEWLFGEGWNENQWVDKEPSIIHKKELDEIAPNNPIVLTRICRHALIANSLAIELAGIDNDTPNPQGGVIVRDDHGESTGYFLDTAQSYIQQAMPAVSQDQQKKVIEKAIKDLLAKGLVGGHTEDLNRYGTFRETYHAYLDAIDGITKKFKAHLLVQHNVLDDMLEEGLGYGEGSDYVELGAVKIFADGALGGRTAWLTEEYSDDKGNRGVAIHQTDNLIEIVKHARAHDLPVALHVIGDRAVLEVAEVLEQYPLKNGLRDRIIHGQILNKEALERLKKLNVVIDIQPTFVSSDFPWVIERVGEHRMKYAYAWKTMLDNGLHCAGGSDAPIEEVNPLLGIQAAVLRRSSIDGITYLEKEKLSTYEAVSLYTKGSAYAINQEAKRGMLKTGYTADFTILDQDIFQVDPEHIHEIGVEMTIVDGTVAYDKNSCRI
ncbi:amidohydrolase [Oceanobacillus halotolerans]|uniref:amidohydrolase n=1 Tax=Oceanobacillus halotolerans TaxID=2663380 RepID=UPI0013DD7F07|nr:amidohydrolase [Oceanobacillus halotolerans]